MRILARPDEGEGGREREREREREGEGGREAFITHYPASYTLCYPFTITLQTKSGKQVTVLSIN